MPSPPADRGSLGSKVSPLDSLQDNDCKATFGRAAELAGLARAAGPVQGKDWGAHLAGLGRACNREGDDSGKWVAARGID